MANHKQQSISYVIKKLRADFGLSQMDLANELGVETSTVQRWEAGVSQPTGIRAFKLREFLRGKGLMLDASDGPVQEQKENDPGNVLVELIAMGVDLKQIPTEALNFVTIRDAQLLAELTRIKSENRRLKAEVEQLIRDKNNLRKFISRDPTQLPSNPEMPAAPSKKRRSARGKASE